MPISPRLWLELETLTDREVQIVMEYLEQRLNPSDDYPPRSSVDHSVETWGYRNGWFIAETRKNSRTGKTFGPYYYYRYHVGGRQKNMYVGSVAKLSREQAQEIVDRKLDR